MAKYSQKCIQFVQNLSIAKIAAILESGKTIAEREQTLKAMDIPKSYLGYIVETYEYYSSKDERKPEVKAATREIRKKRINRKEMAYKLAEIAIPTIDKIKSKRDDETKANFKHGFWAILPDNLSFTWVFEFAENFDYYHDKSFVKWGSSYPIYENVIKLSIPHDWRKTVLKHGLKFIGGMFTISADLVATHDNVKIYRAQWVSGAKGYNVHIHKGLIAIDNVENNYHLECDDVNETTIGRVLECLNYKIELGRDLIKDGAKAEKRKEQLSTILPKFVKLKQEPVSFDLARKAGACHSGIVAWLNKTGLLNGNDVPSGFTITLTQFAKAYQKAKQPECLTVFKFWGKANGFKVSDCNAQILAKLAK